MPPLWWSHDSHGDLPYLHAMRRFGRVREVEVMTAYETFWSALETGEIPVAFEIETPSGDTGLAANGVPFLGNAKAEAMILSDNHYARAEAAIEAIRFTKIQLQKMQQGVRAMVP